METKYCTACKIEHPVDRFNKNKAKKDGLNTLCREQSQLSSRAYYLDNREKHKAAVKNRKTRVIKENRVRIMKIKLANPCACGESDPIALDFHHTGGDKEMCISKAVSHGQSWTKIKKEIDKCEVICANCHRKIHRDNI